jgi:phage gpG-like protein
MSDSFIIRTEGLEPFERQLAQLLAATGNLTPLMDSIGNYGVFSTKDRFDEGVDPQGQPWLPSARAKATGGKTLMDKRHLRNLMGYVAGRDQVEWGTNLKYARRHNQGFTGTENVAQHTRKMSQAFGQKLREPIEVVVAAFTRKANTPKRQFLGLSIADRAEIAALTEDFIRDAAPEVRA